jgi:hypothetical protein
MELSELRKKFSQYNDMGDQEFADRFHDKFYSDMPREEFYTKIGFKAQPAPRPAGTADIPSKPGPGSSIGGLIGGAVDVAVASPGKAWEEFKEGAKDIGRGVTTTIDVPIEGTAPEAFGGVPSGQTTPMLNVGQSIMGAQQAAMAPITGPGKALEERMMKNYPTPGVPLEVQIDPAGTGRTDQTYQVNPESVAYGARFAFENAILFPLAGKIAQTLKVGKTKALDTAKRIIASTPEEEIVNFSKAIPSQATPTITPEQQIANRLLQRYLGTGSTKEDLILDSFTREHFLKRPKVQGQDLNDIGHDITRPSSKKAAMTEELADMAEAQKVKTGGGPDTSGFFTPTDVSQEIDPLKKTKMALVNYHGVRASDAQRADILIDTAAREAGFRNLKPDEYMDLLKTQVSSYQEKGLDAVSPEMQKFLQVYDQLRAPLEKEILEIKPDWQMKENYFRQMFQARGKAWDDFMRVNKSSLEGDKGFLQHKKYETWEKALETGLVPKYSNLADLVKADLASKRQMIEGFKVFQTLKNEGLVEVLPAKTRIPNGYKTLEDKRFGYQGIKGLPDGGRYVAKADIADLVNSQFEPGIRNKYFKAAIQATNLTRQIKVALSPFHMYNVDNTVRGILNDLLGIAEGAATRQGLKSIIPMYSSLKARSTGSKLQKAWLEIAEGKASKYGSEVDEAVRNLIEGGQRFHYDPRGIVRNLFKDADQFGNIFKDAYTDAVYELSTRGAKGFPVAVLKGMKAAIDATSAPTMKYFVVQVKLGLHQIITQPELAALKSRYGVVAGKTANPAMQKFFERDRMYINQRASKFVDNTLGQMVPENIMMKPVLKDILSAGIQFPTWNIGNVSIGRDAGKAAWQKLSGKDLNIDTKLAGRLIQGMIINAGIYGAFVHRAFTGEWPTTFKDAFMPVIDKDSGDRLIQGGYLRSYMNWFSKPTEAARTMLNMSIGVAWELMNNRDFQNARIWTPERPLQQQLGELGNYALETFQPIATSQMERSDDPYQKYSGLVGWQKPASYLTETDLEGAMRRVSRSTLKDRRTADFLKIQSRAVDAFRRDPDKAEEFLDKTEKENKISPEDRSRIEGHLGDNRLVNRFKTLQVEDMISIFHYATPEEREQLEPILWQRVASTEEHSPNRLSNFREKLERIADQ